MAKPFTCPASECVVESSKCALLHVLKLVKWRMATHGSQQLSSNFVKSDSGTETHPEASGLASSGALGHFRRIFSQGMYSKKVKRSANWNSRISSSISSISSNCLRHMGLKIG